MADDVRAKDAHSVRALIALLKHANKQLQLSKPVWTREPALLCGPQTPKPMHGVAPRNILGSTWWNNTRKHAYLSTDNHCLACGVDKWKAKSRKWIEGHEVYDIDYLLGRMYYLRTVPLCHYCHNYIHRGRLDRLLESGNIHQAKYAAIVMHGDRVLAENGLQPWQIYKGPVADWADWRLVLYGKLYPPLYPTYEEWYRVLGRTL